MSSRKRPATGSTAKGASKKIKVGAVRINNNSDPKPQLLAPDLDAKSLNDVVRDKFILLLSEPKNKAGAANKDIQAAFPSPDERSCLAEVINELSRESRLYMSKSAVDNQLYYTLVAQEVAEKFRGLDVSAKMVLQVIEKAGNNGIWTKDIRLQTNIQQQALNKIFKQLEQRRLIKPVKSVTAKAKKLYMLYDLTVSECCAMVPTVVRVLGSNKADSIVDSCLLTPYSICSRLRPYPEESGIRR
jgi:DNA-binding MarR family transcriptional regulator